MVRAPGISPTPTDVTSNRLLRTLPDAELRRVLAVCERVEIPPRQILHHWNLPMRDVYFVEQGADLGVGEGQPRAFGGRSWLISSTA